MISQDMKVQHQDMRELTKALKTQNVLLEKLLRAVNESRKDDDADGQPGKPEAY